MTLLVGLTGGIACGKSTVTAWLLARGVPVVDVDEVVRAMQAPGTPLVFEIGRAFPGVVKDGVLDRTALGDLIFNDHAERRRLNRLMQPHIIWGLFKAVGWHFLVGTPLVVMDAPTLFQYGLSAVCALTVVVAAPSDTQRARIQARDGVDRPAADARIASQMPLNAMRRRANLVVENRGSVDDLKAELAARVLPRLQKRVLLWRALSLPGLALAAILLYVGRRLG
mmetsp:Transcript_22592/g.70822  ORF Transcript_22592/g.70822 Transcript_22592/m.70822 type:complete len:225 (+) Transcript_22592:1392-2066(+)